MSFFGPAVTSKHASHSEDDTLATADNFLRLALFEGSDRRKEVETTRQGHGPRIAPTEKECEAHELAHTPYRVWCAACVRGRRRNLDHKRLDAERERERSQ
eukprot:2740651-Amphidinium_carterae.1